jgi:hypothetical protein
VNEASPGPASIAALRDAVLKGREPPPVPAIARLAAYWWLVVATVCIGSFMGLIALNEAHAWGPTSPALLGCALAAVILMVAFMRSERRTAVPLVDLALFRRGAFTAGNIAGLMSYAALFGIFFLMPFVFARVYGDSALAAGLRLSIVPTPPESRRDSRGRRVKTPRALEVPRPTVPPFIILLFAYSEGEQTAHIVIFDV